MEKLLEACLYLPNVNDFPSLKMKMTMMGSNHNDFQNDVRGLSSYILDRITRRFADPSYLAAMVDEVAFRASEKNLSGDDRDATDIIDDIINSL